MPILLKDVIELVRRLNSVVREDFNVEPLSMVRVKDNSQWALVAPTDVLTHPDVYPSYGRDRDVKFPQIAYLEQLAVIKMGETHCLVFYGMYDGTAYWSYQEANP